MANHLVRRGSTYFVRLTIPRDRWADVGMAMGAAGGIKREVVRTLQTGDYGRPWRAVMPALLPSASWSTAL